MRKYIFCSNYKQASSNKRGFSTYKPGLEDKALLEVARATKSNLSASLPSAPVGNSAFCLQGAVVPNLGLTAPSFCMPGVVDLGVGLPTPADTYGSPLSLGEGTSLDKGKTTRHGFAKVPSLPWQEARDKEDYTFRVEQLNYCEKKGLSFPCDPLRYYQCGQRAQMLCLACGEEHEVVRFCGFYRACPCCARLRRQRMVKELFGEVAQIEEADRERVARVRPLVKGLQVRLVGLVCQLKRFQAGPVYGELCEVKAELRASIDAILGDLRAIEGIDVRPTVRLLKGVKCRLRWKGLDKGIASDVARVVQSLARAMTSNRWKLITLALNTWAESDRAIEKALLDEFKAAPGKGLEGMEEKTLQWEEEKALLNKLSEAVEGRKAVENPVEKALLDELSEAAEEAAEEFNQAVNKIKFSLAVDKALDAFPRFKRSLLSAPGSAVFRALEFGSLSGNVHLHILTFSPFIPHEDIKTRWQSLTDGSYITDVRPVNTKGKAGLKGAFQEVAKYLTKFTESEPERLQQYIHALKGRRATERYGGFRKSRAPQPKKLKAYIAAVRNKDGAWELVSNVLKCPACESLDVVVVDVLLPGGTPHV